MALSAWRFCALGFYLLGCGGNAHDDSLALHSQPRSQAGCQWGAVQAGLALTDCKPMGEVAGLSGCRWTLHMRRTAHGHTSQPGGNVLVERGFLLAAGYGACRQHPASDLAQRRCY